MRRPSAGVGLLLLAGIGFPQSSTSQITIDAEHFGDIVGAVGTYMVSTTGSIPVDLGQAGPANWVWNFSDVNLDNCIVYKYTVVDAQITPSAGVYPGADFVLKESDVADSAWFVNTFVDLLHDSLRVVGKELSMPPDTIKTKTSFDDYYPVPLEYGTEWTSAQAETLDFGGSPYVSATTNENLVDAWGTIQLPIGIFDCLRIRTLSTLADEYGEITWVRYTFVGTSSILLAIVQGEVDDPDLNFSNAVYVEMFSGSNTGVKGRPVQTGAPESFRLLANFPNPFNPVTHIRYDIPSYARIDLSVFKALGEKVKTLYSGFRIPGQYTAVWDGTDAEGNSMPSGVYCCRLRGQGFTQSRNMTLVR
jgi:hypothetical protein